METNYHSVNLVDRFFVPATAIGSFRQRMNYNRNFIKEQPGFINDSVYEQQDEKGGLTIITVAAWENEETIKQAKNAVQAEYEKTGFNMPQFLQQTNIVLLERGIYHSFAAK